MLRSVCLSNFILFSGENEFKFDGPGAHFFIGQNGSGKSSVFEAVRRCLSADLNTSMSSRKDTSKEMYVICQFDIPQDETDLKTKFRNAVTLNAGVLQLPHDEDVLIYKYVAQIFSNHTCRFCIDRWYPTKQKTEELAIVGGPIEDEFRKRFEFQTVEVLRSRIEKVFSRPMKQTTEELQSEIERMLSDKSFSKNKLVGELQSEIKQLFSSPEKQPSTKELLTKIKRQFPKPTTVKYIIELIKAEVQKHNEKKQSTASSQVNQKETDCYEEVKEATEASETKIKQKQEKYQEEVSCHDVLKQLDDCVVFTMAHRSIGPLQWSQSKFITKDARDRNYKESQKRAEIIKWFLSEQQKAPKEVFDEHMEKDIFKTITEDANYEFKLEKDPENKDKYIIKVESDLSADFLKTPEGIVEAKNFSLIMASKSFLTVLLEEPATGLNCQVIERMRDCILQSNTDKTILLTTHHPSFIAPWMLPRMWLFRKEEGRVKFYEGSNCFVKGGKTSRLLASDHLSKLLFARKVLFCEGDSDYFFLTQLRQSIMQKHELAERIQKLIQPNQSTSERKERIFALASLQIIRMCGQGLKSRLANICVGLGLQHAFVVDEDVICNDKWKNDLKPWIGKDAVEKISEIYEDKTPQSACQHEKEWEKCRKYLREEHGIFVWRDGALEDMLTFLMRSKQTTLEPDKTDKKIRKIEWREDIGKLEELKKCNVHLRVDLPSDHARKGKKFNKIYMDDFTSQEDIEKSVDIFLNACISGILDPQENDLIKFIDFLMDFAKDTPVQGQI